MQPYTTLYTTTFATPSWGAYEYTFRRPSSGYRVPGETTFKIDYSDAEVLFGSSFKKPVKKPEAPRMPEPAELLEFLNGEEK